MRHVRGHLQNQKTWSGPPVGVVPSTGGKLEKSGLSGVDHTETVLSTSPLSPSNLGMFWKPSATIFRSMHYDHPAAAPPRAVGQYIIEPPFEHTSAYSLCPAASRSASDRPLRVSPGPDGRSNLCRLMVRVEVTDAVCTAYELSTTLKSISPVCRSVSFNPRDRSLPEEGPDPMSLRISYGQPAGAI